VDSTEHKYIQGHGVPGSRHWHMYGHAVLCMKKDDTDQVRIISEIDKKCLNIKQFLCHLL